MRKHPTIHDVARRSGVSKSTVSNVIRGVGNVAPETRRRVLEAVAKLGYRPNALARNLVQRRTSTLGLVVGDLANPFFFELAKLVEARASEAGYTSMICNTDGRPDSERARIESLLEHRVAGVMMLQFSGDDGIVDDLVAQGVPLVLVTAWHDRSDCVTADDANGARQAVEHLLELGHTRILYVSSPHVEPSTDRDRREGYVRALADRGLEAACVRLEQPAELRGDPALRELARRELAAPAAPTAFFCSNDLLAIDLLETLAELDVGVPEDASVVGFDDIALAGLRRVGLTTVAQPTDELAECAIELLTRRIEHGPGEPSEQRRLDARLVVRASTGPPPDAR